MARQTTGTLLVAPTASGGILLTGADTDDWSDWEEVIASASEAIVIAGFNYPNDNSDAGGAWIQVQFGIGAAGIETPICTYLMRFSSNNTGPRMFFFDPPMEPVPAGSRVSIRQRSEAANTFEYRMFYHTGFDSDHALGTVGASGVDSNPLTCIPGPDAAAVTPTCVITPNGSAWAWSDWEELAAAGAYTTEISLVALVADALGAGPHDVEFQIGIGAASSETAISTLRAYAASGSSCQINTIPLPALYPLAGPSPRLSVRLRKQSTTTDDWTIGLRLYGNTALLDDDGDGDGDDDDPPQVGPDPDEREIHVGPDARGIWVRPDLWLRKGLVNDPFRSMPIGRGQ